MHIWGRDAPITRSSMVWPHMNCHSELGSVRLSAPLDRLWHPRKLETRIKSMSNARDTLGPRAKTFVKA